MHQAANTEKDGDIRRVKDRKNAKVNKVYHIAGFYPVNKIADSTTGKYAGSQAEQPMAGDNVAVKIQNRNQYTGSHRYKQQSLVCKQPKSSSRVQNVSNVQCVTDDGDRHSHHHVRLNVIFYSLINKRNDNHQY